MGCPLGQRLSLPQLATGLTAVWGMGFTLDALVRVLLAYTIPIDSVPLVSTVERVDVTAEHDHPNTSLASRYGWSSSAAW